MSRKWHRSRQWDDENIPSWAWPVRVILRAFSSIPLAVVLLSSVVVYATLASVPIGLLAQAPTWVLYGLTLLLAVVVGAGVPAVVVHKVLPGGVGRPVRFVATLGVFLFLAAGSGWLWARLAWPRLYFDPVTGDGFRLFADFCERYKSTTLRRLPGLEMSELEFYSWWPLRIILIAFVINMITATVRRIEFVFVNIGVLTVHTGIVTIALGSIYYHGGKLEGDTLLVAGEPGPDGRPTPGVAQGGFYDNTEVALWVFRDHGWAQYSLRGIPRYNDYNLAAAGQTALRQLERLSAGVGDLSIPVRLGASDSRLSDVTMRVVGYAQYAELQRDWLKVEGPQPGNPILQPVRFADLISRLPDEKGAVRTDAAAKFFFTPDLPAGRIAENEAFGFEWTRGMSAARWADLSSPLPADTRHALMVEVPATPDREAYRAAFAIEPGREVAVGSTGFRIQVKSISPTPPFPIITEGYRDAKSSVAVVRVTAPDGSAYDRWVYHRFPEISQDLLDDVNERGMPRRRNADPAIRISYIDASKLQVYLDEDAGGTVRALVRLPRGEVRAVEGLTLGATLSDIVPSIDLKLTTGWAGALEIETPNSVPEPRRRNDAVGTHSESLLAVEVSAGDWSRVVWLPFTRYSDARLGTERTIDLPGGRRLMLAFGRRWHALPGFMVQLLDFKMTAYDHRGAPRDYESLVRVIPTDGSFAGYEHVTKLNAPLQAPFMWADERAWFANVWGLFSSRLSPKQFKFSQSGWDRSGWERTQALADQGQIPRPYATFTILGVGNNPGIHVIAAGGVLMSIGIPWAFYVKPWLLRRRKRAIGAQVAEGTFERPALAPVGAES